MLRTDLVRQFGSLQPELKWHSDLTLYHLIALRAGVAVSKEIFRSPDIPGRKSYSDGSRCWKEQRDVISSIVKYVNKFPEGEAYKRTKNLPYFFANSSVFPFVKDSKLRKKLCQEGYQEGCLCAFACRYIRRLPKKCCECVYRYVRQLGKKLCRF